MPLTYQVPGHMHGFAPPPYAVPESREAHGRHDPGGIQIMPVQVIGRVTDAPLYRCGVRRRHQGRDQVGPCGGGDMPGDAHRRRPVQPVRGGAERYGRGQLERTAGPYLAAADHVAAPLVTAVFFRTAGVPAPLAFFGGL